MPHPVEFDEEPHSTAYNGTYRAFLIEVDRLLSTWLADNPLPPGTVPRTCMLDGAGAYHAYHNDSPSSDSTWLISVTRVLGFVQRTLPAPRQIELRVGRRNDGRYTARLSYGTDCAWLITDPISTTARYDTCPPWRHYTIRTIDPATNQWMYVSKAIDPIPYYQGDPPDDDAYVWNEARQRYEYSNE